MGLPWYLALTLSPGSSGRGIMYTVRHITDNFTHVINICTTFMRPSRATAGRRSTRGRRARHRVGRGGGKHRGLELGLRDGLPHEVHQFCLVCALLLWCGFHPSSMGWNLRSLFVRAVAKISKRSALVASSSEDTGSGGLSRVRELKYATRSSSWMSDTCLPEGILPSLSTILSSNGASSLRHTVMILACWYDIGV